MFLILRQSDVSNKLQVLQVYNMNTNEEHANKAMSNNPGWADFVVSLVDSLLHLHSGQWKYMLGKDWRKSKLQKNCSLRVLIKC